MNIVLFAAPGILGPNMLASLCRRGRERIKQLVLPAKQHSLPNDDLITIAQYVRIPYVTPRDLSAKDFIETIECAEPDVVLVASYDTKIPRDILSIPDLAAVNIHPSLLPKYRGACPEFWAIRNGERKTGVTLHDLTEEFDQGDIILQKEVSIQPQDTLGTLLYKISDTAFDITSQFLDSLHREEDLPRIKQDDAQATKAPLVSSQDLKIPWKEKSGSIVDLIRAANPLGGAWTLFRGFHLKVWHAEILDLAAFTFADNAQPGEIFVSPKHKQLIARTGDGIIQLSTVQYALFYIMDGWGFADRANIKDREVVS